MIFKYLYLNIFNLFDMDKGKMQHINENREKLEELLKKCDYLRDSYASLFSDVEKMISNFDKLFGKTNDQINEMFINSKEVKNVYAEMSLHMEALCDILTEIDDKVEQMSSDLNISKENVISLKNEMEKMEEIQSEINQNVEKFDYSPIAEDIKEITDNAERWSDSQDELRSLNRDIIRQNQDIVDLGEKENDNKRKRNEQDEEHLNNLKSLKEEFKGIVKNLALVGLNKFKEVDQLTRDFGRHMGLSAHQMNEYRTNVIRNWRMMASQLGVDVKELIKFQEGYADATNKSVQLSNKQVGSLYALSKNTGDGAIQVAQQNLDVFASSADATIEYLAKGTARAAKEGLNVKKYSDAFANNIKMASKYTFKNGIDGIQRMTLLSQRLKFDMQSIGGVIDKFSSIEGAIETSAKIQVLGGSFAQNFGNPIEAMSQALLDAEGFTQRIVDTVSNLSVFDRNTGEFSVSAADKMRIRAMADSMGMSYDELFNMSTQSLKSEEIKNVTQGKNLSEEQIAFLANKAQYNKEKQTWEIVDLNDNKYDVSTMSGAQIDKIRNNQSYEKLIQSDVHAIKDFLIKKGGEEKSISETEKGWKERSELGLSQPWDDTAKYWQGWLPPTMGVLSSVGGISTVARGLKSGWKFLRGWGNSGKNVTPPPSPQSPPSIPNSAQGTTSKVSSTAKLRKFKKFNKAAGKIGGAATIAFGALEVANSLNEYSDNKDIILNDENATTKEKAVALNKAKKQRNEGLGSAIGGVAGALAGMKVGAMAGTAIGGPVGTLVGGAIGLGIGALGSYLGKSIGKSVTEDVDETMNELDKKKEGNDEKNKDIVTYVAQANGNLISIDNNVSKIVQMIGYKGYGAMGVINETTNSSSISQVKTDNKNITSSIKIDEVQVKVGGKIQLTSDKLSQNIDIDYLLSDYNFQKGIGKLIVNGIEDYNKTQIGGKTLERV